MSLVPPTLSAATHSSPDFLALQLTAPDARVVEAMRGLFAVHGFDPVVESDDLDLRPARGCLLTRVDLVDAELLLTVGSSGASRIPLTGLDPGWLERAVTDAQAAVLLVASAVRDGAVSRAALRSDVDDGVVLAALVPCAERG